MPFQEGIISEIYERPDNSYVQEPQELTDSDRYYQVNPKVFAKTSGHRQDSRHYKKKSFERLHTCHLQSKKFKWDT